MFIKIAVMIHFNVLKVTSSYQFDTAVFIVLVVMSPSSKMPSAVNLSPLNS